MQATKNIQVGVTVLGVAIGLAIDLLGYSPCIGFGCIIGLVVGYKSAEPIRLFLESRDKARSAANFWRKGQAPLDSSPRIYTRSGLGSGAQISFNPFGIAIFGGMFALSFYLYRDEWLAWGQIAVHPDHWGWVPWAVAGGILFFILALAASRLTAYEIFRDVITYRRPGSSWWAPLRDVQWMYVNIRDSQLEVNLVGANSRRTTIFLRTRKGAGEVPFSQDLWDVLALQCTQAFIGYAPELEAEWSRLSEADWISLRNSGEMETADSRSSR